MAGETLLNQNQLLASFPDNTVGAITALAGRNMIVSEAVGVGFLKNTATFTLPVDSSGVWYTVQNLMVNPEVAANNAWQLNGNNFWVPDYAGVITPAGVERFVSISTQGTVDVGGNDDKQYLGQYFINGAPYGLAQDIEIFGDDEQRFSVATGFTYEIATQFPIDFRIQQVDGPDDMDIIDFRQTIYGIII